MLFLHFIVVVFCVVNAVDAAEPLWKDRFLEERRRSFGQIKKHSSLEVQRFYLLNDRLSGKKNLRSVNPMPKPTLAQMVVRKRRPRRKKKGLIQAMPPAKVSLNELLSKSRQAYEMGRLEEAHRYYSLVKKANPTFTEADQRLTEIEGQMR